MTITRRLLLSLALLGLVVAIGLLQRWGVFAPFDQLAMKIVEHLRYWPGAELATSISTWLDQVGSAGGRIMIALVVGLFLGRAGRPRDVLWLLLTVAAMSLINSLMKLAFGAPRPDMLEQLALVTTYSFPSGHSAGAMTLYGAIALLFHRSRSVLLLCAAMILATGGSRVWLGVHWPSDVIGGWIEGVAWLMVASTARSRRDTKR